MGLVNRFTDFAPDLKHAMVPLQGLLSKKNAFLWGEDHDKAMNEVKKIITDPKGPILKHFDPGLPIQLLTDASRTGIGYVLVQNNQTKAPHLITCGSRFISSAENNYAVVELELLAIQWAVEKCRLYLSGAHFTIVTDHQPLLGIMNGRNLDAFNNTCIQRLMSKLLGYSFTVEWIAGKKHAIADALSCAPIFVAKDRTDILIRKVMEDILDPALKDLATHTTSDAEYQEVVDTLRKGKAIKDLHRNHPAQKYRSQ